MVMVMILISMSGAKVTSNLKQLTPSTLPLAPLPLMPLPQALRNSSERPFCGS